MTDVEMTFAIGGELVVNRLGFGTGQLAGPGFWGPPADRDAVLRLLRELPELGIDFVDTADAYGPYVCEELVRDALAPYGETTIATKGGYVRPAPYDFNPLGRPDYLRQSCEMSLRRLDVDAIDLYQLHRIDPDVPREEQFGVLAELREEGKIRHVGLSQVGVEEIEAAARIVPIATVQNRYNLADRAAEDVLTYCEQRGIGFIPWFPLACGVLAQPGGAVAEIAQAHGATPSQIVLAWLLAHSPVILPIPGTSSVAHLRENARARFALTAEQRSQLDAASAALVEQGIAPEDPPRPG